MEIIKESDLKTFSRCPYSYHLKQLGIRPPMLGSIALSMYFATQRRKLLEIRDPDIGIVFPYQNHAGKELLTAQEMSPEQLVKHLAFKDAEKFANHLYGFWIMNCQDYASQTTLWSYESQAFHTSAAIKEAGKRYFEFLGKHGAPILGLTDKDVIFEHQDQKYSVRIPSIYKGASIVDVSLWRFNQDLPDECSGELDKSSLVTLRLLALNSLLQKYFFRLKFQLTEENIDPILDSRLKYKHFNCSTRELSETSRSEKDLDQLQKAIETFLERVENKDFQPNLKHCNSCPYNSLDDLFEPICRKRNPKARFPMPQEFYKVRSWEIKTEGQAVVAYIQGHEIARLENNEFKTLFPQLDLESRMKKLTSASSESP